MSSAKDLLKSCPTDQYLVITQSNLNAAHLATADAVPNLQQSLNKAESRFVVSEVAGDLNAQELSDYIREACEGKSASVEEIALEPLTTTLAESATMLKKNGTHFVPCYNNPL